MSKNNHSNGNGGTGGSGGSGNDPTQGQAQLEGQLQGQAELQLQGQGQGQGQGQSQGQNQYAGQYVESAVWNATGNFNENKNDNKSDNDNSNKNENENKSENFNLNANKIDNEVSNKIDNKVENTVDVDVKVDIDLDLSWLRTPEDNDVIDIDTIKDIENSVVMPDVVTQSVSTGNAINFDQVNNLTDNDVVFGAKVTYNGGSGGDGLEASCWDPCYDPCADSGSAGGFSMFAKAEGGKSEIDGDIRARVGDDGDATGAVQSADASINQEAFTQTITMGANIQFNSVDMTVVGGDLNDAL